MDFFPFSDFYPTSIRHAFTISYLLKMTLKSCFNAEMSFSPSFFSVNIRKLHDAYHQILPLFVYKHVGDNRDAKCINIDSRLSFPRVLFYRPIT